MGRFGLTTIALAGLASATLAGSVRAGVIASDSFLVTASGSTTTYNDNADIAGQGPTSGTASGFTGNWAASTFYDAGASNSGLSHPASYSTAANTSGALQASGITSDPRNAFRAFSPGVPANAGTFTIWASSLFRFTPGNDDGVNRVTVGLLSAAPANVSQVLPTGGIAGWGAINNMATLLPDTNAAGAVQLLNGASQPVNIADGLTHFFVLQVEHNVSGFDDRVTAWLDPSDASSVAQLDATSAARATALSNFYTDAEAVTHVGFDTNGLADLTGVQVRHDEFRLGDTLSDVAAAVPEPTAASAGLLVAGLAATGRRRRRAVCHPRRVRLHCSAL